jgi:hypothetical protein
MVRFVQIFYHSTVLTSSLRKCNRNRDKQKIQDGGGRHLENQVYVITTVFMVRFFSSFEHSTVPSSSVRKGNPKRGKQKYKMAAAAILKINYTL